MSKIIPAPQFSAGRLARSLQRFLDGDPDVTASKLLAYCDTVMIELGATKDEDGLWVLPDDPEATT